MGNTQAPQSKAPPGKAPAGTNRPLSKEEENERALAAELAKIEAGNQLAAQQMELLEMDLRLNQQMAVLDGEEGAEGDDLLAVASNVAAADDDDADLGELNAEDMAELEGELEEMERALSSAEAQAHSSEPGSGGGATSSLPPIKGALPPKPSPSSGATTLGNGRLLPALQKHTAEQLTSSASPARISQSAASSANATIGDESADVTTPTRAARAQVDNLLADLDMAYHSDPIPVPKAASAANKVHAANTAGAAAQQGKEKILPQKA